MWRDVIGMQHASAAAGCLLQSVRVCAQSQEMSLGGKLAYAVEQELSQPGVRKVRLSAIIPSSAAAFFPQSVSGSVIVNLFAGPTGLWPTTYLL